MSEIPNWLPGGGPAPSVPRYCNNMNVSVTPWDFTFDFTHVAASGGPPPGVETVDPSTIPVMNILVDRIVMSPEHAKAFLGVLRTNVEMYEGRFGEIKDIRDAYQTKEPS